MDDILNQERKVPEKGQDVDYIKSDIQDSNDHPDVIEEIEMQISVDIQNPEKLDRSKEKIGVLQEDRKSSSIKKTRNKGTKQKYSDVPKITADPITAGSRLEYRMKRLVFFMGYFPKIGVEIRTSSDDSSDKITDLDVYGLYVHKDFTCKTLWSDCKSGGVDVHKRISWIKGIMSEIKINDVIFVSPRARTSVKQYARKSGIQILDLTVIEKLEVQYGITQDDWRGSWNPQTQYNRINALAKINIPTNDQYKKIAKFITSDYWVLDNFSKAKKAMTALKDLASASELLIDNEQLTVIKWAIFELIGLFLLAILDIAKELYYFTDAEKKQTVHDGLLSSDIPNKRRNELFDTAIKVAFGLVKNHYPEIKLPDKMPSINLTPPSYFEAFNDLIQRVTNNPLSYHDLLRFLDFSLMEYDLQFKQVNESDLRQLFNNYDDVMLGAKTLLNFLCQITNIPRSFFEFLK